METVVISVVCLSLLLVVAAVLSSIWQEHYREKRAVQGLSIASAPARHHRDFSIVSLSDAFEPELACIWEPQIEILLRIKEAGATGLELEQLRPVHRQFVETYPELYEGSDLESWLEAMERTELIAWSGEQVWLTAAGTAFLKCRLPVSV